MNLKPSNQLNLYGLDDYFQEFVELYNINKLPSKILLTGSKGIGKSTIAYHLINFVLSKNEDHPYDLTNYKINLENKSFKLLQNNTCPNFILIDVPFEKKMIDITEDFKWVTLKQIKELILENAVVNPHLRTLVSFI